jgi:hypothetical protein
MIKKTRMNKKFPCHFSSLKEDAIVVASQATDHLIVKRKTRFPKKSGPSTRLKPATSQASKNANTNNMSTRLQAQGSNNASKATTQELLV